MKKFLVAAAIACAPGAAISGNVVIPPISAPAAQPTPASIGAVPAGLPITIPESAAPPAPTSGITLYVDANGALHALSPWYDATLPGGKFAGDASRPWFTTPIGIGVVTTGSTNNQPALRIQKTNNSTLAGSALSVTDTVGALVSAQNTSVILNSICGSTQANAASCVAVQIESDKFLGHNGHPFGLNVVGKDASGNESSKSGSVVAIEADADASGPDDALLRVVNDVVGREIGGPSPDGPTSIAFGVRVRPSDNSGNTTGPVQILRGILGYTEISYPGASFSDVFASDGGALNGLHLYSASITAVTNAASAAGATTITCSIDNLPAAQVGDPISDGTEAGIPAGTTITAISTTSGVTTLTLSAPLVGGGVASAAALKITDAFGTGVNLSGYYTTAAVSIATQYGQEMSILNGLALGSATGGTMGPGTVNLKAGYANGTEFVNPSGAIVLLAATVATLPTCNPAEKGVVQTVTDAASPAYNTALTGGGAVYTAALCNGSAWIAH